MSRTKSEEPTYADPTVIISPNTAAAVEERLNKKNPYRTKVNAPFDTKGKRRYYTQDGVPRDLSLMPKKVEALFILLNDQGLPSGVPIDEHQIDHHPLTKDLPLSEKRAILKYWPRWNDYLAQVDDYKKQVRQTLTHVESAKNAVTKIKKEHSLIGMTLGNKLKATAQVLGEQVVEAALRLSQTSIEKAHDDPVLMQIYKVRIQHTKDLASIARTLNDLGKAHESAEAAGEVQYQMTDETASLLADARMMLIDQGVIAPKPIAELAGGST